MRGLVEYASSATDATHVIRCDCGLFLHNELRNSRVIVVNDRHECGPSLVNGDDHDAVRKAYWMTRGVSSNPRKRHKQVQEIRHTRFRMSDLENEILEAPASQKVVLWVEKKSALTGVWSIVACEEVVRSGRAVRCAWVETSGPENESNENVVDLEVDENMVATARAVWTEFVQGTPLSFATACLRAADVAVWYRYLPEVIADLFPRVRSGKIYLSQFDSDILTKLTRTSWVTVLQAIPMAWTSSHGLRWRDLDAYDRLLEWAANEPGCAVDVRESNDHINELGRRLFKLSTIGEQILVEGLRSLSDAPMTPIGGFEAYGRGAWVCTQSGGDLTFANHLQ